jgi:hypothetical protein
MTHTSPTHSPEVDLTNGQRRRLGVLARAARLLVVPFVLLGMAAATTATAEASTSSIGAIGGSVYCVVDLYHHTSSVIVDAVAVENPAYPAQYVSYRYEYFNGNKWVASLFSPTKLVDAVTQPNPDLILTQPVDLGSANLPATFGSGRIPSFYIQGAFWNGHSWEYTNWTGVSYYSGALQGSGASPVPCSV